MIYLLENANSNTFGLGPDTLYGAISQCMLDGFIVKETANPNETVNYICCMTKLIESYYKVAFTNKKDKDLIVWDGSEIPNNTKCLQFLDDFNDRNTKHGTVQTISHVWMRQLMTIKGLTLMKAKLITKECPTMTAFYEKYPEKSTIQPLEATLGKAVLEKLGQVFY